MKNFDDIEKLWRQQTVVGRADPQKIRVVQSAATRVVGSRGRLLKWLLAWMLFSVFASVFFTVVNFVRTGLTPTPGDLVQLVVNEVIQICLVIGLLRRIRAHRALRRKAALDVRSNVEASLEAIIAEMRDYRTAARIVFLLLAAATVGVIHAWLFTDVAPAKLIAVVSLNFGLNLLFLGVGFRHYRRVLRPQKERLIELRDELNAP